jgi:YD repeat-containing protein
VARRSWIELAAIVAAIGAAAVASASETINYRYDAKGRLVKVERSGNVNNGVNTSYSYDKADNRTNVTVNGSSNPPP